MLTYQDFLENQDDITGFIERALSDHASDPMVVTAELADEYDKQRNRTVMNYAKYLYDTNGTKILDTAASTNRIASNFFHRMITQRTNYLLGNGIQFAEKNTKEKLGNTFDSQMKVIGRNAIKHGLSFGFWNKDKLINFTLREFIPLWNEDTSALSAGIRFWQLDDDKPRNVVLYEADGYTEFSDDSTGKHLIQTSDKKPYISIIQHTDFGGDEIVGYKNYSDLPIKAMWGNPTHQSALIGLRSKIDAYDLIASGFANDLDQCAEIYWLIQNANGMDDRDLMEFRDKLKLMHIAKADRESTVTPYTQEVPYSARKEFLDLIRANIYEDFGGLDVHTIAAGATNDHIDAAYQPLDEEADDFEFECTEFIKQILSLQGIEDEPVYKRNRISNQMEQVQMLTMVANYLDDETILANIPFVTVDQVKNIIANREKQDMNRFNYSDETGDDEA